MPFSFKQLNPDGIILIEPAVFSDSRGFFFEAYRESDFKAAGIIGRFVQDNHSLSKKGVLRGLHYQLPPYAQGKLVRVIKGRVWDAAVDIRKSSPAFLKWTGEELSEENRKMLYIPPGFAHGFAAMSDDVHLVYKCTAEYNAEFDTGIRWDDPSVNIDWPVQNPLISKKDRELPFLKDARLFE